MMPDTRTVDHVPVPGPAATDQRLPDDGRGMRRRRVLGWTVIAAFLILVGIAAALLSGIGAPSGNVGEVFWCLSERPEV